MKKESIITLIISLVLVALFVYSLFFVKTKFNVVFINEGEVVEKLRIEKNSKLKLPEAKTKDNYKFIGWYYNGKAVDENTKVVSNMNIEAKYEEITTTTKKKKKTSKS